MRPRRAAMLLAFAVIVTASPISAQEDVAESTSPEAEIASPVAEVASPEPVLPPKDLGGAWRRTAAGPFGANDLPGGWTGKELIVVDPEGRRRAAAYRPTLDRWETLARPPQYWPTRSSRTRFGGPS